MRLKRPLRMLAVGLILATVTPGVARGASQAVTIASFAFTPPGVTINAGETVTWTNRDQVSHTATSDTPGVFDTGPLSPGAAKSIPFAIAGTYAYHCSIHPSMTGTVTVLGPAPTPVPSTPRPTVAPIPPPTAAPTPRPASAASATPTATATASPSPSPSASPAATPSPTVAPPPGRSLIAVPNASAVPSRPTGPVGPGLGDGPGPALAIAGIVVAVALAGVATLLYRRR